jgi:hypothetical protein
MWGCLCSEDVDIGLLDSKALQSSALRMEAVCSSETLVSTGKSTRLYCFETNIDNE